MRTLQKPVTISRQSQSPRHSYPLTTCDIFEVEEGFDDNDESLDFMWAHLPATMNFGRGGSAFE